MSSVTMEPRWIDDLLLSTLTVGLNEDFGNAASNLTLMPEPSFPSLWRTCGWRSAG